jgi:glycerophosphoryl diester phosphodiesterase
MQPSVRVLLLSLSLLAAAHGAQRFVVHGHRGAPALRPENTIASFQEAIRAGADYIELDVNITRDNVLVIVHDPVVNQTICRGPSGRRPIRELTLKEVKEYDCGGLPNPAFPRQTLVPGERIPTLDEVLDLARSSGIRFNIEIKSSEKRPEYTPPPDEYARMVVAAVRKHKLEKRVLVQSFDFRVVKALTSGAPDLDVAALYSGPERSFVDIARETGARVITPVFSQITPEKVKEAHQAGLRVIPWTPDRPADWDRLIDAGVDGIITNEPGLLVKHLKARGMR